MPAECKTSYESEMYEGTVITASYLKGEVRGGGGNFVKDVVAKMCIAHSGDQSEQETKRKIY